MAKFIKQVSGVLTEEATGGTGGGTDANKIPNLDSNGQLTMAMMPTGIGADTVQITASEALSAGDYVNIWNSSGPKCRKADATAAGKEAHGFVLAAVSNAATATIYLEGTNNQHSSLTAGNMYLSTTPGAATATPPSTAGNVIQRIGVAVSATQVSFEPDTPIVLA